MFGYQTFSRSRALVRVMPWCPSCASDKVCFHRLSGRIIRFPRMTICPKTQISSDKALYIVPDRLLQSPLVTASRTSFRVGSLSEASSTSLGVRADGIAWLARLHA